MKQWKRVGSIKLQNLGHLTEVQVLTPLERNQTHEMCRRQTADAVRDRCTHVLSQGDPEAAQQEGRARRSPQAPAAQTHARQDPHAPQLGNEVQADAVSATPRQKCGQGQRGSIKVRAQETQLLLTRVWTAPCRGSQSPGEKQNCTSLNNLKSLTLE